ncbi:hypothetical protein K438DRAFT_1766199 [Mycena galopus ATCC 62051]|nr:hypothetical protein K438DRAFT_1766199 [Mycena galopus ATCC 62051]
MTPRHKYYHWGCISSTQYWTSAFPVVSIYGRMYCIIRQGHPVKKRLEAISDWPGTVIKEGKDHQMACKSSPNKTIQLPQLLTKSPNHAAHGQRRPVPHAAFYYDQCAEIAKIWASISGAEQSRNMASPSCNSKNEPQSTGTEHDSGTKHDQMPSGGRMGVVLIPPMGCTGLLETMGCHVHVINMKQLNFRSHTKLALKPRVDCGSRPGIASQGRSVGGAEDSVHQVQEGVQETISQRWVVYLLYQKVWDTLKDQPSQNVKCTGNVKEFVEYV